MSNKVDKLFKDKLEGDALQPSAQAWEKVEAHLGKKNKMVLWVRVAAAVTLLGVLTFVGFNWNGGGKKELVVRSQELEVRSQELGVRSRESEPVVREAQEPKEIRKQPRQNKQPKLVTPMIEQQQEVAIVPEPKLEMEPNVIETELTTQNSQATTQKGITLTYSLPPVKKLDARQEPQVAEQKKTGFERVIEIAKEVKNGDALGELRQAKDDIFAFDFRKDKKNKQ